METHIVVLILRRRRRSVDLNVFPQSADCHETR